VGHGGKNKRNIHSDVVKEKRLNAKKKSTDCEKKIGGIVGEGEQEERRGLGDERR